MPKILSLKKAGKNNQKPITTFFKNTDGSCETEGRKQNVTQAKRKADALKSVETAEKNSESNRDPNVKFDPKRVKINSPLKQNAVISTLSPSKSVGKCVMVQSEQIRSPLSKLDDNKKCDESELDFIFNDNKCDLNTKIDSMKSPSLLKDKNNIVKSTSASPKKSSPVKENQPADFELEEDFFGDEWETQIEQESIENLDLSVMQRCEIVSAKYNGSSIELRLKNGENHMGTCYVEGVWCHTPLTPGEIISITAPRDAHGRCAVTNSQGLLVLRPDHLMSTTSVVAGVFCRRKAVLQERFKGVDSASDVMTMGIIVHELVQKALQEGLSEPAALRKLASDIIKQSTTMLYDAGLSTDAALMNIEKYVQPLSAFMKTYVLGKLPSDGNMPKDRWPGVVDEVLDIEENVVSPHLGLKGKIDATLRVTIHDRQGRHSHVSPLELKSGMASGSAEHRGQLLLYCLMLPAERALLLYLKEKADLREVSSGHPERRDLIMLRNELVQYLTAGPGDIDPETTPDIEDFDKLLYQKLPEPIHHQNACSKCAYLTLCSLHLWHSGEQTVSDSHPLSKLRDSAIGHLNSEHIEYFLRWSVLLRVEEMLQQKASPLHALWTQEPEQRAKRGVCAANMTLKAVEPCADRFVHLFERNSEDQGTVIDGKPSRGPQEGEFCVVSAGDRPWVASGTVTTLKGKLMKILLERDLSRRLPKTTRFHADSYESYASAVQNLTNLGALMEDSDRALRLRELVISKSPSQTEAKLPREVGRLGVTMMKGLNVQQQRAVLKAIAANNYVLLQGLPGTGKTQTISVLIQMLVALKKRVLVTAHTHSAVDTVLTRLPSSLKILRLGTSSRVSASLQDRCERKLAEKCSDPEQLAKLYDSMEVVGVTCLGAAHALLARTTFDVCIVDEATQVLQSTVLRPLLSASKFVLVGDPEQLPPVVRSRAARRLGMEESLFHRLNNDESTLTLQLQYRMNAPLAALANTVAYNGRLHCANHTVRDATVAVDVEKIFSLPSSWLREVCSPEPELAALFLDLGTGSSGPKLSNKTEGCVVLAVVGALLKCSVKPSDIGVIAPYREQVSLLRRGTVKRSLHVDVSTVDQFQGRDKSVVLYSCTRSDIKDTGVKEGEVLNDKRRLAVSVTRAKHKFILIGHYSALKRYGPLQTVIDACRTISLDTYVSSIVSDYGSYVD